MTIGKVKQMLFVVNLAKNAGNVRAMAYTIGLLEEVGAQIASEDEEERKEGEELVEWLEEEGIPLMLAEPRVTVPDLYGITTLKDWRVGTPSTFKRSPL